MRSNIQEYIDHISKLEREEGRNKEVDLAKKVEKYKLSAREAEVLKYIAQGLKNKEIADKMFVSLSTVKTHTKNIFDKMDVRNRIEAVRKAQAI
jgi:ATP/maltotriose-dependent transcriptional regulator MalT